MSVSLHAQQCILLFFSYRFCDRRGQLSHVPFPSVTLGVPPDGIPGIDGWKSQRLRKENEETRTLDEKLPWLAWVVGTHVETSSWRGMVQRLWWWLGLMQFSNQ